MTKVWGYGEKGGAVTYPGPTFDAVKNVPITVKWMNWLPYRHLLPVDNTLHMAKPKFGIATVTHLHGGHTESASDGLPEAWFTQHFAETGPQFVKETYRYDNDQESATLWYHDHALGITRLNVYAGLAGFYLLRDFNEAALIAKKVLPFRPYEIEIVIQDRRFTTDGALFLPSTDPEIEPGFEPLPPGPSVIAEFFGDFILVNGMTWPRLNVEPRKYRLRLLNGSDSRFYVLKLSNGQQFYQIGTDNGFLPEPVPMTELLFAPGERADVIVDFSGLKGQEVVLLNFGPDDPFKGFNADGSLSDGAGGVQPAADPATTGQIMKFVVDQRFNKNRPDASVTLGTRLRPDIQPLAQTGATRHLALFEGLDEYGRLQPLLGTLDQGSLAWFEPITENPMVNDVEVWEVYNSTEDAHPIHLHLVSFQIINRESFEGTVEEKDQPQHGGGFGVGGKLTVTSLGGDAAPPAPNEAGWKDTAVMLPGQVTRVIAKFDREGRYVWHCHILSHEDHEMMRPYYVGPVPAKSSLAASAPDAAIPESFGLAQNFPNPFNPSTTISFSLPEASRVSLAIYNINGELVRNLVDGDVAAGQHMVVWDGKDATGQQVATGVYLYRLRANSFVAEKKLILAK